MQRLKRKPLLLRLGSTAKNLLDSVDRRVDRLGPLPQFLGMLAWMLLCLGLLLTLFGCTTRAVRPPLPPQAEAREVPSFQGQTYRDVILYVIELKETAQQSEADKAAIRRVYGRE